MGWWYRGWWSPYPGYGPWSHLPPPLRPGWLFRGRGWCWWYPYPVPPDPEAERRYLEEFRRYLSEVVLKEIDRRLEELKGKSS